MAVLHRWLQKRFGTREEALLFLSFTTGVINGLAAAAGDVTPNGLASHTRNCGRIEVMGFKYGMEQGGRDEQT